MSGAVVPTLFGTPATTAGRRTLFAFWVGGGCAVPTAPDEPRLLCFDVSIRPGLAFDVSTRPGLDFDASIRPALDYDICVIPPCGDC